MDKKIQTREISLIEISNKLQEIEDNILIAEAQLAEASEAGAEDDFIEFKETQLDKWIEKQKASETLYKFSRNNILPEIHYQAHIRIDVMPETRYELFAKIQSEVEEALHELRDIAAKELFEEPYAIIKKRFENDKQDKAKDGRKLSLLEVLYPARIIEVKPK